MVAQGIGRVPMVPPTFSGGAEEEVEEFVSNYLACARGNGWGDALALTNLSYYLRGQARAVYDSAVKNGTFLVPSVTGAALEALKARVKVEPSELQAELERLVLEDQTVTPQVEAMKTAMMSDPSNVTSELLQAYADTCAEQAARGGRMAEVRAQLGSVAAATAEPSEAKADGGEPTTLEEVMDWLRTEFTFEHTRDARVGAFVRKRQKRGESARSHAHALLLLHRQAGLEYNKQQLCATFVNSLQEDLKRLLKAELATRPKAERDSWEGVRELADTLEKKYFHLVNPSRGERVGRAAVMETEGESALPVVAAMQQQRGSAPARRTPLEEVECYSCHQKGHYSSRCPTAPTAGRRSGGSQSRGGGQQSVMVRRGLRCYECGQIGHYARDCAERVQGRQGQRGSGANGSSRKTAVRGGDSKNAVVAALSALVAEQKSLND
jgi:hypothetical protein